MCTTPRNRDPNRNRDKGHDHDQVRDRKHDVCNTPRNNELDRDSDLVAVYHSLRFATFEQKSNEVGHVVQGDDSRSGPPGKHIDRSGLIG